MVSMAIGTWPSSPPALVPQTPREAGGGRGEQGIPLQCFGGAVRGRMREPRTQPPTPMDLPQDPPVLAVPSARGHRLHPARGVLASVRATLGRDHPAPPCPLPGAARDLQASFVKSAASTSPTSPLRKQGQGLVTPPLRSLQGKPSSLGFIPTKVKASQQEALTVSPLGPADPSIPAGPWGKAKVGGGLGGEGCCSLSCSAGETPAHRNPAQSPRSCLSHPRDCVPISSPFPLPPPPPPTCTSCPEQGLQPAACPRDTALPTHQLLGGHKDPQGQGHRNHLQSTWGTSPSSSFLAQQAHGGGGHPHLGDMVGSEPGRHPLTCVPLGPGGPRLPCKPCGPCKAAGDEELLLESNPCTHRAKPAVQNLSWEIQHC